MFERLLALLTELQISDETIARIRMQDSIFVLCYILDLLILVRCEATVTDEPALGGLSQTKVVATHAADVIGWSV